MKNICVFGMGGIGGYMTMRFVSAKNADPTSGLFITCIARGESLKVLGEEGLRFRSPGGQEDFCRPDLVTDKKQIVSEAIEKIMDSK